MKKRLFAGLTTPNITYDNNGNTLTSVTGTNTTQYFWDFENRMSSVTLPGSGGTVTFKYDPFGQTHLQIFVQRHVRVHL